MKSLKIAALAAALALTSAPLMAQPSAPPSGGSGSASNPQAYSLLSNASASGAAVSNVVGGSYILDLRGTLGGATVTLKVSDSTGTLQTLAVLTAVGTTGTYQIGAGSQVQAVVSGGSPTGLYLNMQGVGPSLNVTSTNGSPSSYVAAASTNATNVKASATVVTFQSGYNPTAVPTWITTYDIATTPTCGTGIKERILLPANSTNGSGAVEPHPAGSTYLNGYGFCMSLNPDGTGAVAAGAAVWNVDLK